MTQQEALEYSAALVAAVETRAALVALMKSIAGYGRPSSYPDDVRAAWDDCERIVGNSTVSELLAITSKAMHERGQRQVARAARRRARNRVDS